ncbi:MAG: SEC-C metal-binding domain-containing protein [Pseudomonadota bacterium]
MAIIGRNDPCPCGSGKKYKKCCLAANQVVSTEEFYYQRVSEAYNRGFDKMAEYAGFLLGPEALDWALTEYWMAIGRKGVPEGEEFHRQMSLFTPWMIFNWLIKPVGSSKKTEGIKGKTIAEIYIQDKEPRMDSLERRVAEASNRVPYRFFEVLKVDPGKRVHLKEVLTGAEQTVQERAGSQYMHPGDLLFGRVIAVDQVKMFVGLAPYVIPPAFKVHLIELRNRLKAEKSEITEADIVVEEVEIRRVYLEMDTRLHQPPAVCNTDGDPLEQHKLVFQIDSPETVLAKLASLSVTESEEEILSQARYDKDGRLQKAEWDWSRLGYKHSPGMSNTVLGNLSIEGRKLTVQVNSAERAKKIRKIIEKRLDAGVRFKLDKISPFRPQEALASAQARKRQAPSSHESLMQNPEVQQYLAETMRAHWDGWVDMKIPALGKRTPREAMLTADGREALEALLSDFEQGKAVQPELDELNRRGVQRVRELLGLPKKG